MAYKKWIKKNGKLYGPYTYHSRRVNGKVVSEYHGSASSDSSSSVGKSFDKKKFFSLVLPLIGAFLFVVIAGFLFFNNSGFGNLTGNAVLNLNGVPAVVAGENDSNLSDANVLIELSAGELIPSDSNVVIETPSGEKYEFQLKDLVSDSTTQGDFYSTSALISGNGEGYGAPGTNLVYPDVDFTLEVLPAGQVVKEPTKNNTDNLNSNNSNNGNGNSNSNSGNVSSNESNITNLTNSTSEENSTSVLNESLTSGKENSNSTTENSNENASNSVTENNSNLNENSNSNSNGNSDNSNNGNSSGSGEVVQDNTNTDNSNNGNSNTENSENGNSNSDNSNINSNSVNENSNSNSGNSNSNSNSNSENSNNGNGNSANSAESENSGKSGGAGITGAAVGVGSGVSNFVSDFIGRFFSNLGLTGNAVSDSGNDNSNSPKPFIEEVSGTASNGNDFEYKIKPGETVRIKAGSVSSNSNSLGDGILNLETNGASVVVSTDYSEEVQGFGFEYNGDNKKELSLKLSDLGINLSNEDNNGTIKIKVKYQNETILEAEKSVSELIKESENPIVSEATSNESNVTINESIVLTNETLNKTIVNQTIVNETFLNKTLELTDSEIQTLVDEFGNVSVSTTKAEKVNGRVLIRLELGDYWVEHSYTDDGNLETSVEKDRVAWLKQLASSIEISKQSSNYNENVSNLIKDYPLAN